MNKTFLKLAVVVLAISLVASCGLKGKLNHPDEVEGTIYDR